MGREREEGIERGSEEGGRRAEGYGRPFDPNMGFCEFFKIELFENFEKYVFVVRIFMFCFLLNIVKSDDTQNYNYPMSWSKPILNSNF